MKNEKELQQIGENAVKVAEFANAINMMLENEKAYVKQIKLLARLRFRKYQTMIEEGFTEQQALFLLEKTDLFN